MLQKLTSKIFFSAGLGVALTAGIVFAFALPKNMQAPQGYVSDYANIIDDDAEQYITSTLTTLDSEGRGQVAVVTVPSLEGSSIEEFAVTLFNEWGIGDAEKDDGVLLLIAPNERKLRIEVGYGTEGVLTDLESSWIIRDHITPKFKTGDMSGGVVEGVDTIVRAIGEDVPESETRDPAFGNGTDEGPFGNAPKTTAGKLAALFVPLVIFSFFLGTSIKDVGGIAGLAISVFFGMVMGSWIDGILAALIFVPIGSAISRFAFRHFPSATKKYPFLMGGGGSGFGSSSGSSSSSSSSGGFGGGSSGGGGASGRW